MSLLRMSFASQLQCRSLRSALNGVYQDGRHCFALHGTSIRQYNSLQPRKPHGDIARMSTKQCLQLRSYSLKDVVQVVPDAYLWAHEATGLPWWVLILFGALAVRLPVYCLMPAVHRRQAERRHAMSLIQDEQMHIARRIETQPPADNKTSKELNGEVQKQLREAKQEIIRERNCQLWKSYIHLPILFPAWTLNTYAIWHLVVHRELDLHCAMLAHEGPLSSDLLAAHPVLGAMMFLSMMHLIELPKAMERLYPSATGLPNPKTSWIERLQPYCVAGTRIAAVNFLIFAPAYPSAFMLSLLAGNASMALLQTSMELPAVRRFFKIKPTPYDSQNLLRDLRVHYKALFPELRESVRNEVEKSRQVKEKKRSRRYGDKSNDPDSVS